MELKDLLLTPIFLIIIYTIAFAKKENIADSKIRSYFIPALTVKIIGAISLGLIYQFYYSGGDTFNYFRQSKILFSAFINDPTIGFKMLFVGNEMEGDIYKYASQIYWFRSASEFFIIKLAALLSLFCFGSYTVVSIFFAIISFSGLWALYKTFLKLYPALYKEFAYAIFFIPSVFFWGSGLLKDTLCIGALGWLFYSFYNCFVEKKHLASSVFILLISIYVIKTIKIYILLSFLPPAFFWIFIENNKRINNKLVRNLLAPFFLVIGLSVAFYVATNLTKGNKVYDIENFAERTKINAEYLYQISQRDQGSGYNLGELDGTLLGTVKLAPKAIFVTLFRPFLWEVRNPVMLLSAIEALFFFIFTLYTFIKVGIIKSITLILRTPILLFCFIFSLIFAFGVGINSYNFGTLVRYKIPLLPFYVCGMFILVNFLNTRKKNLGLKVNQSKPLEHPSILHYTN